MPEKEFVYIDGMGDSDLLDRMQQEAEREGRSTEFHIVSCCTEAVAKATEAQAAAVLANTTTKIVLKD